MFRVKIKTMKSFINVTLILGASLQVWQLSRNWNLMFGISKSGNSAVKGETLVKQQQVGISDLPRQREISFNAAGNCYKCLKKKYTLLTNKTRVCSNPRKVQLHLLVIIMSTLPERNQRSVIRQTWASYTQNNTADIRYVFLLGSNLTRTLAGDILDEIQQYQDIVVFDVIDTYSHLTLKTILGLRFAAIYCNTVRYVMKTDTDVYINLPPLLKLLKSNTSNLTTLGLIREKTLPIRNVTGSKGKWYVSFEEYPYSEYPDYLDGSAYVLSLNVVKEIVAVSPFVQFFKFEDVFIGMCLKQLGYNITTSKGFWRNDNALTTCSHKATSVYAVHGVSEQTFMLIWNSKCKETNKVMLQPSGVPRNRWIRI